MDDLEKQLGDALFRPRGDSRRRCGQRLRSLPLLAFIAALTCLAATAAADEPERPWAQGVSVEDQQRATELFAKGNALLEEALFSQALELYEQALSRWSHPAIHFNAAVALINLDRIIDAQPHLESALRWGAAALEKDVYDQAIMYQRLLAGQLARITVVCDDPGARVSVDGKELVTCPGTGSALMRAGEHQLVAERLGYLTLTSKTVLSGGEARSVHIRLIPLQQATVTRRRWVRWKPWAVLGAGVALELAGVGLDIRSAANISRYDDDVAELCGKAPCAQLPSEVTDRYDRGRLQNRVAIGLYATGGAAIATGVALLILNRPFETRVGYDDLVFEPIIESDGAGVVGRLQF